MESGMNFEGPRHIHDEERRDGYQLFELCFGHFSADDPDTAGTDTEIDAGDGGWYVMLPTSGPHQGQPVSQINTFHSQLSFGGSRLRIGSIGGVSTHPDYRNLGLAGRILHHCAHILKDEGARLMLISGERGLYTRTGNVEAMRFLQYKIFTHSEPKPGFLPAVITCLPGVGETAVIAKIYQSEPVAYVRRVDDYPARYESDRIWLVEMDGAPVAYLVLHVPWEYWDGQEHGVREVTEFAGSRLAVAAGIYQLVNGTGDPSRPVMFKELRIAVPWQDVDLTQVMHAAGLTGISGPLPGHTLRLINFSALREDLEDYIAARLPVRLRSKLSFEHSGPLLADPALTDQSRDLCAIVWGSQRLELSTARMTRLVFGDWDVSSESILAELGGSSPLAQIIESIFPLPSFQPGLNYR